jgi:class 3 adenylate cyclase
MVKEASVVRVPASAKASESGMPEFVNIRVEIYACWGYITCGILGRNLPKFSVFGHTVNIAARMEQSFDTVKIHLTDAFFNVVREQL